VQYLVVCVVLAGCFASRTPAPQQPRGIVPPPKVLRPLPLKAGQWARYRERDAHGEIGQTRLEAVATSFCGTWVRATLTGHRTTRTWLLCVADHGATPRDHIARALVDDGGAGPIDPANPGPYAAELDALATRIGAPDLAGAYGREDVTVPAGSFDDALVAHDAASTTWLHPLVPFAGVVKIAGDGGREDVLDDFGDHAVETPERFIEEAAAGRRQRPFVAVGLGVGQAGASVGLSGIDSGTTEVGILGWHATRVLDVIGELGRWSELDMFHERHTVAHVGAGVRYCPWRRAVDAGVTFDPYVQGVAGFSEIDGNVGGPGAMASAGMLIGRGGDWGLATQVDFLAAHFNANTVTAASIDLLLQLELR